MGQYRRSTAVMASPQILVVGSLVILALGIFLPLAELLRRGLGAASEIPIWGDPFYRRVLAFTYGQAFLSSCCAMALGIPTAFVFSECEFPGKRILWRISLVSFSLPTLLGVLGWVAFWGRQGWVNRLLSGDMSLYGWPAILMVHTFFNFPIFLRGVYTAWQGSGRGEEWMSLSLGASRWTCFWDVTWRKILPAVRSAFVLCFLYCSASFLIVLLLGGGPRFTSVETAVYQAIKVDFDLPLAVRFSLIQIVLGAAVYGLLLGKRTPLAAWDPRGRFAPLYFTQSRRLRWIAVGSVWIALFMLVIGPLAALEVGGWEGLNRMPWAAFGRSMKVSLILAVASAGGSLLLALPMVYVCRHRQPWVRSIERIALFPLMTSSLVLMLALWFAYPQVLVGFRGSLWPVGLVQAIVILPLGFRTLRDGWDGIADDLVRVSHSLGAGPWRTLWHTELPLLKPSLVLALLFGMALSFGEVAAAMMFLSGEEIPLSFRIYRLFAQYRIAEALAMGSLLLIVMVVLYGVIERVEKWNL